LGQGIFRGIVVSAGDGLLASLLYLLLLIGPFGIPWLVWTYFGPDEDERGLMDSWCAWGLLLGCAVGTILWGGIANYPTDECILICKLFQ
jgi:hypothetical protein|tara:strand:+ start:87 stop:356 length:270 start_codon:yes stop_codon:yes gene_type:complete